MMRFSLRHNVDLTDIEGSFAPHIFDDWQTELALPYIHRDYMAGRSGLVTLEYLPEFAARMLPDLTKLAFKYRPLIV